MRPYLPASAAVEKAQKWIELLDVMRVHTVPESVHARKLAINCKSLAAAKFRRSRRSETRGLGARLESDVGICLVPSVSLLFRERHPKAKERDLNALLEIRGAHRHSGVTFETHRTRV